MFSTQKRNGLNNFKIGEFMNKIKNAISGFIAVLVSASLFMASADDQVYNKLNDEQLQKKLTKSSARLEFTDKDYGTKKRSGPENFRSDFTAPKDITLDFLKKSADKFGFSVDKENVEITRIKETPGGTVVHFKQLVDGIPVYLSNSSVTINKKGILSWANVLYRAEANNKKGEMKNKSGKTINAQQAVKIARDYLGATDKAVNTSNPEKMWFETRSDGVLLVWKVTILNDNPYGDWEIIVGAENGDVIQALNLMFNANGKGMVFDIDPLRSAHVPYGTPYVDSNDIDIPELNAQRKSVVLRDISKDASGIFRLRGPYCVLDENVSGTPDTFPERADSLFNYTRTQDEFEDVMCYYHLDSSARYLNLMSFYDNGLDSMKIDPHGMFAHNAEFAPGGNRINMGDIGIDAAEDAEIILHEYGHAIEHNVGPGLTMAGITGEPRAVWEACSDYWAVTYGAAVDTFRWSRQGLWYDAGIGRSMDSNLIYPEEKNDYDAMYCLSNPLMNIWWAIGKKTTDTLFLQMISQLPVDPSLSGAAMAFINADYTIYNGLHRIPILNAFDRWGLVKKTGQIPFSVIDSNYVRNASNQLRERFDDWDLQGTDGADNEHFLHLNHAANLRISTCSPSTNFDTKLEIYRRDGSSTGYYNNDATCGSDPTHSTLNNVSLPAGQYYIVVDGNNGATGAYQLSVSYSHSLQIYLADQAYSETNIIKPMFYIVNNGSQSLSNFTVSYYFTVENSKTPVLEDYYTPDCTPSLQNLGSGFYRINFNFAGTTLAPGQRLPASGQIVVGVHYSDWSIWDKTNDYSQPGASFTVSNNIAAFNSADELIYGSVPDVVSPAPPMLDLDAFILDEGYYENTISKPRFYIHNQSSSTSISDFVVKYYFTVENGKTPVIEDYWTPNCSISLQQISGNSWCAVYNFAGYTLQPGGRVPADGGIVTGLHYSDWSQWNKSNDYSQPASNNYSSTERLAIYNSSGVLVYGSHP